MPHRHEPIRHEIHGRVVVYGSDHCEDTAHTRRHLNEIGIEHEYVDIDRSPAELWVVERNQGKRRTPTVAVGDRILSVPRDEHLDRTLQEQGLLPS